MALGKDKYYWAQLRAALTAGEWSTPTPGKDIKGYALTWSDLFRKFKKHCSGYDDVAEVASQNHALAVLLTVNGDDEPSPEYPLDYGDECLLPEEHRDEARIGYEVLKKLESSNFDTLNFALAYYAYALGDPSECIQHLQKVPDVSHVQNHIPLPGTLRASTALKPIEPSESSLGSNILDSVVSINEIKDGRAWAMTETFRSLCLQGMSYEKLSDPAKALECYSAAFPLLAIAESEIGVNIASMTSGNVDFTFFSKFRELWRWAERLLWRATVLAATSFDLFHDHGVIKGCPHNDSVWTWFRHYSACSAYWPSNFRTNHRSTVSVLYLRALVLGEKDSRWPYTARSIAQEYRAVLSVSTKFPRAGERNVKVEDFVDLCIAIWEAGGANGEHSSWLLDILWWATRITFNSFRILRHMTRVLYVSGDHALAKRTLRLYVQVVDKAWQASGAGVGTDADTDINWVETLVFGIRMICKLSESEPATDVMPDLREAQSLVEMARKRLDLDDKQSVAAVDLAAGVCTTLIALKHHDHLARPVKLVAAHNLLVQSVNTYSTSSACYHLALSFARPGPQQDLNEALVYTGRAVEGDPKEVRYWHLLGLLLSATEQWEAANVALETGAAVDEPEDDEVPFGTNIEIKKSIDGLPSDGRENDSHIPPESSQHEPSRILQTTDIHMPPASNLLNSLPDHPPPSRHEQFEYSLQLRMTQIAVSEAVEGPEGAAEQLRELFAWIADKNSKTTPTPDNGSSNSLSFSWVEVEKPSLARTSVDARTQETSIPSSHGDHEKTDGTAVDEKSDGDAATGRPSTASTRDNIPINVSPATPVPEEDESRVSSEEKRRGTNKGKVQQLLKEHVHRGGERISTISKKIGGGMVRRTSSTPDFHVAIRQASYQASSIHSRARFSSLIRSSDTVTVESPPPPPVLSIPPTKQTKQNKKAARETRLLSDVWLMSAATFRRLGKIEQAKGAIQEAEVRDEANPAVWVQLGLYYHALGSKREALDSFQKALFIDSDNVPACIHLCRIFLDQDVSDTTGSNAVPLDQTNVDLAAGMLSHLTKGPGWDVPEAWYFLAKAYGMQGRRSQEKECLSRALLLSETRGTREFQAAVGWCI